MWLLFLEIDGQYSMIKRYEVLRAFLVMILLYMTVLCANPLEPKLDKGEKRFSIGSEPLVYHMAWKVTFLDLLEMETKVYTGKPLQYKESLKEVQTRFWSGYPSLSFGDISQNRETMSKNAYTLMNILLKQDYFWKVPVIRDDGKVFYRLTGIIFKDSREHLKAIETLDDIKEMLGDLDTSDELFLWIYATEKSIKGLYSYKKIGQLYRVRFVYASVEFFRFYDAQGYVVDTEILRR